MPSSQAQTRLNLSTRQKRHALHLASLAFELSPAQQQKLLDRETGDDPALREEVRSLLAADLSRGAFLDRPPLRLLEAPPHGKVGPYRILRQIGAGGMGRVYLAVRDDQTFQRLVAIKVLKRGMDSDDILRRFGSERQILANLNHPNIAQLHEAGSTLDGLPYLAMEYVDGLPILEHCKVRRFTLKQRLQLFAKVCRAVQFAHQNMVIHRDLKPANILVTAQGEPKLLDFGIAKLLHPSREETATRTEKRLCTPEYASPEQLLGGRLTTACDVYALGVLLYELITGRRPIQLQGRPIEAAAELVGNNMPVKPSAVIGWAGNGAHTDRIRLPSDGRPSGKSPHRLRRSVAGDLDHMVLMSLRKEPERRYASAGRFADDIDRHLRGFPVSAVRESLFYWAQKWIRRHSWATVTAVSLLALVLGFGTVVALQWRVTQRERNRVHRVSELLVDMFEARDPYGEAGRPASIEGFLDRAAQRANLNLDEEPSVRAQLLATIGRMYMNLGKHREAGSLFKESFSLKLGLFGPGHPETAVGLYDLGSLALARGNYAAAEDYLLRALAITNAKPDARKELPQKVKQKLAELYAYRGQFPKAAALLAARDGNAGDNIQLASNRAELLRREKRFREAESLYRQVAAREERELGPDHPRFAVTLNQLANVLLDQECYEEAMTLYHRALAIFQKNLGEEHPETATARSNLGTVNKRMGLFGRAEYHYQHTLIGRRKSFGNEHRAVAESLNHLARLYHGLGHLEAALPYYDQLIDTVAALHGTYSLELLPLLNNLSLVYRDLNEFEASESLLQWMLAILDRSPEVNLASLWNTLKNLALLEDRLGKLAQAESHLKRMLVMQEDALGIDHPQTAPLLGKLACVYRSMGRLQESQTLSAKAEILAGRSSTP